MIHNNETELYNKFKPLLTKTAGQLSKRMNASYDDIYQEACIGLIYAIRHFSPDPQLSDKDNNNRFVKYAKMCVKGYALNTNTDDTIHIPVDVKKMIFKYNNIKNKNPDYTLSDFKNDNHLSNEKYDCLKTALNLKISYFQMGEDLEGNQKNSYETIADEKQKNPIEIMLIKDQMDDIYPIMAIMPPQQQELLIYYYGLFGIPPLSPPEIADKINIPMSYFNYYRQRALLCIYNFLKTNELKIEVTNYEKKSSRRTTN